MMESTSEADNVKACSDDGNTTVSNSEENEQHPQSGGNEVPPPPLLLMITKAGCDSDQDHAVSSMHNIQDNNDNENEEEQQQDESSIQQSGIDESLTTDDERSNNSKPKRTYKKNEPYNTLTGKYWSSQEAGKAKEQNARRSTRCNAGSRMKSFVELLTERPKAVNPRGRGKKEQENDSNASEKTENTHEARRGPGRPRKSTSVDATETEEVKPEMKKEVKQEVKDVKEVKATATVKDVKEVKATVKATTTTEEDAPVFDPKPLKRKYERKKGIISKTMPKLQLIPKVRGRPGRKPKPKIQNVRRARVKGVKPPVLQIQPAPTSSIVPSPESELKLKIVNTYPRARKLAATTTTASAAKSPLSPLSIKLKPLPEPPALSKETKDPICQTNQGLKKSQAKKGDYDCFEVVPPSNESETQIKSLRLRKVNPNMVSPVMALQTALSIPNALLPTSNEEFLDKHGWTYDEDGSFNLLQQKPKKSQPMNRANSTDADASNSSSSAAEELQQKENTGPEKGQKSETRSLEENGSSSPNGGELIWADEAISSVVKLGNNKLLIDGETIIEIDYTNYIKESDVPIPYDDEVLFKPDEPLDSTLPAIEPSSLLEEEIKEPAVASGECRLEACKLGCVCKSIKQGAPIRQFCYKDSCSSGCCCLFKDHSLIDRVGDIECIKSRLRRRVTLLNWKKITNGIVDKPDKPEVRNLRKAKAIRMSLLTKRVPIGLAASEAQSRRINILKKRPKTAAAKAAEVPNSNRITLLKRRRTAAASQSSEIPRKRLKKLPCSGQLPVPQIKSKPMPKLHAMPKVEQLWKNTELVNRRPPPLLAQRPNIQAILSPNSLPKKVYSCQPCQIKPADEKENDDNDFNGFDSNAGSNTMWQTASSNFKVSAQLGKPFVVVRPNGSILAKLNWETNTNISVPTVFDEDSHTNGIQNGGRNDNIPCLFLPVPTEGKIWLFFETPSYEYNTAVWLPEIGVHLPADKINFMDLEANFTGQTAKLYMEFDDQDKLEKEGLLHYVYLVPNLPSVLVYGPVQADCLKQVTRTEEFRNNNGTSCSTNNGSTSTNTATIKIKTESAVNHFSGLEKEVMVKLQACGTEIMPVEDDEENNPFPDIDLDITEVGEYVDEETFIPWY